MSLYDIPLITIDGEEATLAPYKGKHLLIVNVASKCGFTPQYEGLETLSQQYKSKGLVVLGFPCDQFGHQEPGEEAEIKNFCTTRFNVSFPMFAKIDVNGEHAHPLYEHLKKAKKGILGTESIKWNFTKFWVDAQGDVRKRYAPNDTPAKIAQDLAAEAGF
ncbi:MAG: glutathione peroxidase [Gammaproteobacteria bacterium]|nr:glutathione peroxidase [Gammaproteobacteria bacterium]